MAEPIKADEIFKEQAELQALALQITPDLEESQRNVLIAELTSRGAALQALGEKFQLEQTGVAAGEEPPEAKRSPWIWVELTPEQRQRIEARLGVKALAVKIEYPSGDRSVTMPGTPQEFVEAMAFAYARSLRQLKDQFAELEAGSGPEALELIEIIKRDPSLTRGIGERLVLAPGELEL